MLRRAPMNYLATLAAGAGLWLVTGFLAGTWLADRVSLQVMAVEDFLTTYRFALGAATVLGVLACCHWYRYGAKSSTALALNRAKKVWLGSLLTQVLFAAAIVAVITILMLAESLTAKDLGFVALGIALNTVIFFWLCSFLFSPPAVEHVVLGKR